MRIAVVGKGGSGKTTVAGTLARALARTGHPVLAIDADSNPNLAVTLGLPLEQLPGLSLLPGDLFQHVDEPDGTHRVHLRMTLPEVEIRFGTTAPDGIRLLVAGRVDRAGRGCMCGPAATVRGLLEHLRETNGRWVVADMEAGLETLSRSTPRHADVLLVVFEPYYKSLITGGRAAQLGRELGMPRIYAVGNKIARPQEEEAVRSFARTLELEVATMVPHDERVTEAEFLGVAPYDHAPDSAAVRAIAGLVEYLADQAKEAMP